MGQATVVKGAYSGYCLRLIQTDFTKLGKCSVQEAVFPIWGGYMLYEGQLVSRYWAQKWAPGAAALPNSRLLSC